MRPEADAVAGMSRQPRCAGRMPKGHRASTDLLTSSSGSAAVGLPAGERQGCGSDRKAQSRQPPAACHPRLPPFSARLGPDP